MKYRSVLFVPGHEEKKIKKSYTLNADLCVIDLESTVPDDQKNKAKQVIKDCKVDKSKTYIRINTEEDLNFVTNEKFLGIFLPFTESKNQLENLDHKLTKIEKLKTDIIPIIESKKGIDSYSTSVGEVNPKSLTALISSLLTPIFLKFIKIYFSDTNVVYLFSN